MNGTVKVRNDVTFDGETNVGGNMYLDGLLTLQGSSDHLLKMQNKGRIGLVAGESDALVINNYDNTGPNILTVATTSGTELISINASLLVSKTTTLGGPLIYTGIETDSIIFNSQRKVTVKNDYVLLSAPMTLSGASSRAARPKASSRDSHQCAGSVLPRCPG